jgi:hypothetical protein
MFFAFFHFVASIVSYLALELMDKSGMVNRIIAIGNMEIMDKKGKTTFILG